MAERVEGYRRTGKKELREAIAKEAEQRRNATREVTSRIGEVEEALKAAEEEQVEVNFAGLPVVFGGIVLTALPEVFAIGSWWSATPVALAAVGWAVWRVVWILRDRGAEG